MRDVRIGDFMCGRSGFISFVMAGMFLVLAIYPEAFAYECHVIPDFSYYPGIPHSAFMTGGTAAQKFIMAAKYTITNPKTEYEHKSMMDGLFMKDGHTGLYLTDCSCFINYLLSIVATEHYKEVYEKYGDRSVRPPVPRAHDYYTFFNALNRNAAHSRRWRPVRNIDRLQPGDILAWSLVDPRNQRTIPTEQQPGDTGHVVIIAGVPHRADGGSYFVPVFDSSSVPHFDLRYPGRRIDRNGVGEGGIRIFVNDQEEAFGYQFCPYPDCRFRQNDQIAAARMVSFR